jgi:hypothetical protein
MNVLGRVGLKLKLDDLLSPSKTFEVILISLKYLRIHNISIHIDFNQNRFINDCVRRRKKWDKKVLLLPSMTFEVILI